MSRIGKIARLPKTVREELNRRLEDGEEGKGLVVWLNGQPEVQAVLKADFDGREINEPNLTAWRQGGYEDWRRQQEALEAASRMVEETSAAEAMARHETPENSTGGIKGMGLVDRAAMMAALAIGEQLMATRRMEDGAEKRRAVLKLVRGLVRLRKSDLDRERAQREAAQAQRAAEIHDVWAERAGRKTARAEAHAGDGRWKMGDGGRRLNVMEGTSDKHTCSGHDSASGGAGCERPASLSLRSGRADLVRLGRVGGGGGGAAEAGGTERGMEDRPLRPGPGLRVEAALEEEELRGLSTAELMQRLEDAKARDLGRKPLPQNQTDPLADEP